MNKRKHYTGILFAAAVLVAVAVLAFIFAPGGVRADEENPVYELKAYNGSLAREIQGEPTDVLDGVVAEPVDSFTWDGEGRHPVWDAEVELEIDPASNTGSIKAEWTDLNGTWTFEQTAFGPAGIIPDHPSGLRVTSALETALVHDDPVSTNVYLHGDTTAGGPVLPTVFNYIATWGPAEVTLDGAPFPNVYDGPTPDWVAHTMTTEGVRNPDGTVTVNDGTIYHPSLRNQAGDIDANDLEFHLVFHDAPGPEMTDNFPPPLSFFYHLTFEDVKLEIK